MSLSFLKVNCSVCKKLSMVVRQCDGSGPSERFMPSSNSSNPLAVVSIGQRLPGSLNCSKKDGKLGPFRLRR